jgi:hypothetical protein
MLDHKCCVQELLFVKHFFLFCGLHSDTSAFEPCHLYCIGRSFYHVSLAYPMESLHPPRHPMTATKLKIYDNRDFFHIY